MRQLADWGVIAANASASMVLRVWNKDQSLAGLFTVTVPQTARMLSACTWSGTGWSSNFLGAEVVSITNGTIYTAPLDDIAVLTTTSGEAIVVGYGLGVSGVTQGQSAAQAFGGGGGVWGTITGTLSVQTDLQSALDGKAATVHTHTIANVTGLQTSLDAKLVKASNLSDLADASTARTNLGLGSAATHPASDFAAAGASGLTFGQAAIITSLGI